MQIDLLYMCVVCQPFFIDHTTRSTTFIDPRLPVDAPMNVGTTGVFSSYSVNAAGNNRHRRSIQANEDDQSRVSMSFIPLLFTRAVTN